MKTERRHELQTNTLADWLGDKVIAAQTYSRAIWASIVAIVVIVVAVVFFAKRNEHTRAAVWQQYFNATNMGSPDQLSDLADQHGNTLAGHWARVSLGDTELSQGMNQLFEDRTAAQSAIERAIDSYEKAREQTRDAELLERATLGLARGYETLGKLPQARGLYQELLAKWPSSIYATEARQRLADIDRQGTKEFYDWLAKQNTKPPLSNEPGVPGLKPKFDTSSLPSEPGIQFEHGTAQKPAPAAPGAIGRSITGETASETKNEAASEKAPQSEKPAAETPAAEKPAPEKKP